MPPSYRPTSFRSDPHVSVDRVEHTVIWGRFQHSNKFPFWLQLPSVVINENVLFLLFNFEDFCPSESISLWSLLCCNALVCEPSMAATLRAFCSGYYLGHKAATLKSFPLRVLFGTQGSHSQSFLLRVLFGTQGSHSKNFLLRVLFGTQDSHSQSFLLRVLFGTQGSHSQSFPLRVLFETIWPAKDSRVVNGLQPCMDRFLKINKNALWSQTLWTTCGNLIKEKKQWATTTLNWCLAVLTCSLLGSSCPLTGSIPSPLLAFLLWNRP